MIAVVRIKIPMAGIEPFCSLPADPPPLSPGESRRAYVCPDHPENLTTEPGRCPIDRKQCEPRPLSDYQRLRWWCPMHPNVTADQAGASCKACGGMILVAQSDLVPSSGPGAERATVGGCRRGCTQGCLRREHARHVRRRRGRPGPALRRRLPGRSRSGTGPAGRDRRCVSARCRDALEPQPRSRLLRSGPRRTQAALGPRWHDQRERFRSPRTAFRQLCARRSPAGRAPEALPGDEQAARLDGDAGAHRRRPAGSSSSAATAAKTHSDEIPSKYLSSRSTHH